MKCLIRSQFADDRCIEDIISSHGRLRYLGLNCLIPAETKVRTKSSEIFGIHELDIGCSGRHLREAAKLAMIIITEQRDTGIGGCFVSSVRFSE